ncbi:MAG: hypothetical protein ACRELY_19550 [Polyangiaceae bacterium]
MLVGVAACAMLAAVESCAVDPFLMCGDACDDAGIVDASLDAGADVGADDGSVACVAKSCDSYPGDCHSALDDGCGHTIDCASACPPGQVCVIDAGADAALFFCNGPPICHDAGAPGGNCGTLTNPGNGLTTACGTCGGAGFTCTANICGCAANRCTGAAACCSGATPDCTADAGACCKKKTCASNYAGKCSSTADNGCGSTLDCSANCNFAEVCDLDSSTCCSEQGTGQTCSQKCGTVIDNCDKAVNCGSCGNNDVCYGSSNCACGSATCTPGQECKRGPDQCI